MQVSKLINMYVSQFIARIAVEPLHALDASLFVLAY